MSELLDNLLVERWAYVLTVVLMTIGLYGMLLKRNLFKKLIGLNIFQAGIVLLYIVVSYRHDGSVPIRDAVHGAVAGAYVNPIPHGLMLTAIVVLVATSGVGLTLLVLVFQRYGTVDEDELLKRVREEA